MHSKNKHVKYVICNGVLIQIPVKVTTPPPGFEGNHSLPLSSAACVLGSTAYLSEPRSSLSHDFAENIDFLRGISNVGCKDFDCTGSRRYLGGISCEEIITPQCAALDAITSTTNVESLLDENAAIYNTDADYGVTGLFEDYQYEENVAVQQILLNEIAYQLFDFIEGLQSARARSVKAKRYFRFDSDAKLLYDSHPNFKEKVKLCGGLFHVASQFPWSFRFVEDGQRI